MSRPVRVLGEYATPESLLSTIDRLHAAGFDAVDAYSPYRVPGLLEELELGRSRLPAIVFIAAVLSALAAWGIQYWADVASYPLNAGGRPAYAIPSFVAITFETLILGGSVIGFAGLLWLLRLPRWHYPIFELDGYEQVTRDRFWVTVQLEDGGQIREVERLLKQGGAQRLHLL